MIWKKLKKVIIPLIIVKSVIFVFFIFKSDIISISRDFNYSTNYEQEFEGDSTILKRQKLIRIVRNEEEPGISIKVRGREKPGNLREKEEEISVPVVDQKSGPPITTCHNNLRLQNRSRFHKEKYLATNIRRLYCFVRKTPRFIYA